MKLIPKFLLIMVVLFVSSLNAQEVVGEIPLQDYQQPSLMVKNENWLFTPYGVEGFNGVIIMKKDNHEWKYEDTILKPSSYEFGSQIASDKDWLLVSDHDDWEEVGEVPRSINFYHLEDSGWTFKQKIIRDFSLFTYATSISNEWAVAGDYQSDSVFVYHLENNVWTEHQAIGYEDSVGWISHPWFGRSVKIYGDYIVVCAPYWANNTTGNGEGAFFIYKRQQDNNWVKIHSIYTGSINPNHYELFPEFDFYNKTFVFSIETIYQEGAEFYTIEFDDGSFQVKDSILPAGTGLDAHIKLIDDRLFISEPNYDIRKGRVNIYRQQNNEWEFVTEYTSPNNDTYFGQDIELDDNSLLVSTFNAINIIGVKKPIITSVSQGHSRSNSKIVWENNSSIEDIRFKVFRDNEEIATTSGVARSYFDYEGIPGKMHTYGVATYDPLSSWTSVPDTAYGYKQPSGIIEGKVQTPLSSGVKEVQLNLRPEGITMHRAIFVDSTRSAVQINEFKDFPDTALTISFWFKTIPGNTGTLFDYYNDSWQNAFTIRNPQNITISINDKELTTNINLDDGEWHHLAVTWRTTDGQMYLYDNGVQVFQDKFLAGEYFERSGALASFGANLDNLILPDAFHGWLDELRIWDNARSKASISADRYNRFIGNEDGLVSYYNFDDPQRFSQNIVPDLVWKRANHGSIIEPVYEEDANEVIKQKRIAYTDAAGKFTFKNVYYDETRGFVLDPFKTDHGFSPGSLFFNLDTDDPENKNVVIIDTTSFTVGGKVYYTSTNCPLPGAELILNGKATGVFTDVEGSYLLTIEDPGNVQLEVVFADSNNAHLFVPSSVNLQVNDNLFDVDFSDITTSRLYGRVGAACANSLGVATLNVVSTNQCYSRTIETDTDGNYSIDVPSQKYIVTANIEGLPILFDVVATDLTFQDTLLNFIDREPPTIRISGFPETCFDVPVVAQYEQYSLTIEVLDSFGGDACPVDTGFITIYDNVGGNPNEPVTLRLSNGQAHYILKPGIPNTSSGSDHPFQKLFQVVANVDGANSSLEQWMLITGHQPRGRTFFTKTPELPLLILRDPPGDNSYSYLEQGETITSNFTMSRQLKGAGGIYTDMKIGAGIPVPFTGIVIGARTHIEGQVLIGKENNKGSTLSTTITNSERFSTSDADNITGTKGDIFIGASFNMAYALTDIIDFDESSCSVVKDTQVVWGSEEINTDYIYTESHIRNTLLPQLRLLRSLASPDSAVLLGTYIDVWEQVLVKNERLKRAAKKEKNISFSAGTSREYSSTITTDSTLHIDFTTFIDAELKIGAGFGDGDFSDIEVGVAANFRWSKTTIIDTTFQKSTTVGYVLADDDEGDFFSVDVKTDPVYNTPVFELVNGTSSCPWEPGSQPRDGVQLAMDSYIQNDVPLDQKAAFALYIGNTSQSGETRDYALSVIQASNLDGAIISVGGVVIENALDYTIPAGEQIKATLAVERGPLAWDYENLKLRLYSPCDPSISDTISFSVHFQSPCTDVNIFRPNDKWLVNIANHDTLSVVLNDYDHTDPDLEIILLEYRQIGGSWKTAFAVLKNELPNNYVSKTWDVSALSNGNYEMRAVARCKSGLAYSKVLTGKIDRSALIVFGKPQPNDGILNLSDEIKIAFSEELDCDNLSENAVQLLDEDGNVVAVKIACSGKELIVTPQQSLSELEGELLTAKVTSVKDITGNVLREPYSWSFCVNQNPLYWSVSNSQQTFYKNSEPAINITLHNAGIENGTFNLISLPTWLTANTISGSIPPSGISELSFEISKNLNPGTYADTLFAETNRGNEPFFVEINVLAEPPSWIVASSEFTYSMNVTAQLNIKGNPSDDIFDIVAAFVGNDVRGTANVQYVSDLYGYLAFITIYSNSAAGEQITFSGWDASQGSEYANVSETFSFQDGTELGDLSNPIILNPKGVAQNIDLNSGWTWISLNVQNPPMNINTVLNAVDAQVGDIIKSQEQFAQYVEGGGWQGSLQTMQTGESYLIKLSNSSNLRFIGNLVKKSEKFLQLGQGWSWIGFIGNQITDINTALIELDASDGDRIKSQTAFAEYDAQSASWIGSLEYLKPGQGYKIKTNATADFNFSGLEKISNVMAIEGAPESWQVKPQLYEYNMNLVARLDFGTKSKLDSLDIVAAFVGDECRAVANPVFIPALNKYQVFLTIFGEGDSSEVKFKMLEQESGIIYSAGKVVTFVADTTLGSIEKPINLKTAYATNEGALPTTFKLYQNYPNPFNPFTTIRYEIPTRTDVKLIIYNVLGQEVKQFVNKTQNAGRYQVDIDGRSLSSGIYFYKFEAGNYSKIRKMLLIK